MDIQVFKYIEELDAFVCTKEFIDIVEQLVLIEWLPCVFIGRYFCMDNDYGEHYFDNWNERENLEGKANELGYNYNNLLIVNPCRFKDDRDGPCHTDELRQQFWTNVMKSLKLSLDFIIEESRYNQKRLESFSKMVGYNDFYYLTRERLEEKILAIRKQYE